MEITLLVKSFLGLVVILAILVFFLLYIPGKKKATKKPVTQEARHSDYKTLNELLQIIKDKTSTTEELGEAVELVMKYHGTIHPKMGIRSHPDFDIYSEMLLRVCRHPNINKDILLKFNRELEKKNEAYKIEINDAVTKGLN